MITNTINQNVSSKKNIIKYLVYLEVRKISKEFSSDIDQNKVYIFGKEISFSLLKSSVIYRSEFPYHTNENM